MDDNLVPIVAIVLGLGGWILGRLMKHRERMAMLQMGIVPPQSGREARRWRNAQQAWIPGEQMPPPGMPMGGMPRGGFAQPSPADDAYRAQCTLRGGVTTALVGLALFIGLSFIGYHPGEIPPIRPGPWLIGGLIPMFVGIAQIINALMQGATFSVAQPRGPFTPPPMGPPPGARSYGAPSQPGQPGIVYEELARPVKPPDRI
jgi:hypothetical protein